MKPQELDGFNPSTEWTNYGDANPDIHGGLFVKYDPKWESWEIVETTPLADIDADEPMDSDRQYVCLGEVDMTDIFVDGDPENGLSDRMKRELEALSDTGYDPDEYPDIPADETTNYGYAPDFLAKIDYYVAGIGRELADHSRITDGERDYDDMLQSFGVDDYE